MRKLIVVIAVASAALGVSAQAASASIDPPNMFEPPECGIPCITGPDPDDLPTHIPDPVIEDPPGPSDPGEPSDAVCTSRVKIDGATVLGHLHTLIQCPAKQPFDDAKLAMLSGDGMPKCDRRNDVIRLHFLRAQGGTSLRPTSGECLRNLDADSDREVLYEVQF